MVLVVPQLLSFPVARIFTRHIRWRFTMTGQMYVPASRPRRASQAAMVAAQPAIADWVRRVRAGYLEMPGLILTVDEIQRMWGIDAVTCAAILNTLVAVGFLRRTRAGGFVRADGGPR
jgi:hypothetical protein